MKEVNLLPRKLHIFRHIKTLFLLSYEALTIYLKNVENYIMIDNRLYPYFTFELLIPSFALGARLIPILPFILIACPADRESTNTASSEWIAINSCTNIITTYLAFLATQRLYCLFLSIASSSKIC